MLTMYTQYADQPRNLLACFGYMVNNLCTWVLEEESRNLSEILSRKISIL